MRISVQIKTDNAAADVSSKMKQGFAYYNIKHITGVPHNPTGQTVIERSNHTLRALLNKQKGVIKTQRQITQCSVTCNILNANEKVMSAVERQRVIETTAELSQAE